jgi:hypothetical protein
MSALGVGILFFVVKSGAQVFFERLPDLPETGDHETDEISSS